MVPRIYSIDSVDIQLNAFDVNYSATGGSTAPGHTLNLQVDIMYNVFIQCTVYAMYSVQYLNVQCTVCLLYNVYVQCTV